jgi:hypothetical protein
MTNDKLPLKKKKKIGRVTLKLQNGVVGGALPGVVTAVLVQSVVSEVSEVDVISLVEIEVTCEVSEDIITVVVVEVSILNVTVVSSVLGDEFVVGSVERGPFSLVYSGVEVILVIGMETSVDDRSV